MKIFKALFKVISSKQITQTLLNVIILLLIVLLIHSTSDVWGAFLSLLWKVIKPFFFAFVIAFVLNPLINWVEKYVKKRYIALTLIYGGIVAGIIFIIIMAIPMVYNSIFELYPAFEDGLIYLSHVVEKNFDFDISHMVAYIQTQVSSFMKTTAVLDTTFEVLNRLFVNATSFLVYMILAIYISSRYSHFCSKIKQLAGKIDEGLPVYISEINEALIDYLKAFSLSAMVTAGTTMIMYLVIGHPNWFLMGVISGLSSIIPYVGPILANVLGAITSITLGPSRVMFLLVLIFIQSNVNPYIIQPRIFSAKINLSIMWILFGIMAGSTLAGPWGMIIAMPLLVTCKITYRVYRQHHPLENTAL